MENTFRRGNYLLFRLLKRLGIGTCSNGTGVFSLEDIRPGDMILQFGGPIFSGAEIPYLSEPVNDYFLQIDDDLYLGPSGEMDDYVNHSCDPNGGLVFSDNGIGMKAISFIPQGSEITYDYSTTMNGFWGKMQCNCNAANCRKTIRNFLDIPDAVQQRYTELGIVPEYITKKQNQTFGDLEMLTVFRPAISAKRP
jgi:hypothetical protein